VMSDHGSGPTATRTVHLNAWLRQQGWLALRAPSKARAGEGLREALEFVRIHTPFLREFLKRYLPNGIKEWISRGRQNAGAVEWPETIAYRVPMAFYVEGVNVNVAGRQPAGTVAPGEADRVRAMIAGALLDLRDPESGERIVRQVLRKEEAYPKGDLARAPDLIVFFDPRYTGGGGVAGEVVTPVPRYYLETWSGQHMMEGTFVMAGLHVRRGATLEGASIVDVAPTVLHLLGLPIPADMDGRVLTEAFDPAFLDAFPPQRSDTLLGDGNGRGALSADEEREMKDALRALGYLS
jgi:predicted AlkP superfamily phosphohydrolase/phosphomutase